MRVVVALLLLAACDVGALPGHEGTQPDGGGGPQGPSAAQLAMLKQWSGCMTQANFATANMANAWGRLQATTLKSCQSCHSEGQFGFVATTDQASFFSKISQHSSFMAMYFTADMASNKVIVNTNSFKAAN